MQRHPLALNDRESFFRNTIHLAPAIAGRGILLTGGTGFFGTWLVECLLDLNRRADLGLTLWVVSRAPLLFRQRSPHLAADPALRLLEGDIRSFTLPPGTISFVIHAAADSVRSPQGDSDEVSASIVQGTAHTLQIARRARAERFLFVSSGAVYGPQFHATTHISEDHSFAPDGSPYTAGKRAAEELCAAQKDLHCVIARPFAFLGPHLPLDAHFAAGNFLGDALEGRPITIRGDGTPLRSYLYAGDLAVWLCTLLLRGAHARAYNVGSEHAISIRALAERTVAAVHPGLPVHVLGTPPPPGTPPACYVPSTQRAKVELGLTTEVELDEAIRRTAAWHRAHTLK